MLIALAILVAQAQLGINTIVGNDIDAVEARKYHLFTDIHGFVSARFSEAGDSVAVALTFREDGTVRDSVVTIDQDLFAALRSYIHNLRTIVEDREFRESFVQTFKIGWPVVAQRDIDLIARASKNERLQATTCCMTGGCGLGAYTSALLTRKITTDTLGMPVPCLVGGEPGCIFVPIEIRRYSYSELSYLAGAGFGTGLGYAWSRMQHRVRTTDLLCRAIGHDILAFDNADFPITEAQVAAANRGKNELMLGTLGAGAGLLAAGITACVLYSPWADMLAREAWQGDALAGAVIVVSIAELSIIANYFIRKGQQLDRQATIERLRDRETY
jgi:hypothetical protein